MPLHIFIIIENVKIKKTMIKSMRAEIPWSVFLNKLCRRFRQNSIEFIESIDKSPLIKLTNLNGCGRI